MQNIDEPTEAEDGLPLPERRLATCVVIIGTFMAVLDATITNSALPTFVNIFHVAPAVSVWTVNAFQLSVIAALLPCAALGDRIMYRRVYLWGLILFTLGSLACAASRSIEALIAARMLQGLGAGGVLSVGPALYRVIFPRRLLGQGLGISAMVVATSSASGPALCGLLLSIAPWYSIFAINIPIGILNSILAWRILPRSQQRATRLDTPSIITSALGLSLTVLSVDAASRSAHPSFAILGIGLGIALFSFFLYRQRQIPNPLIAPRLLTSQRFTRAALTSFIAFLAQGLALVPLPFLMHGVLTVPSIAIGLLISLWPLAIFLTAPLAGWLADRTSPPRISTIGLVVFAGGLALQATIPTSAATPFDMGAANLLAGIGFGLFQSPNNRELLGSAPPDLIGSASGVLATVRVVAQTLGAATAALLLAQPHMIASEHLAFLGAATLAAVAACASATRLIRNIAK